MNLRNYELNRKRVAIAGQLIILAISLLSCVSTFQVFRLSFADFGWGQDVLGGFATVAVEGFFLWVIFAFRNTLQSGAERFLAVVGIVASMSAMLINLTVHALMAKNLPLSAFQKSWMESAGLGALVCILALVLLINLADTGVRLMRSELRFEGRKAEALLQARTDAIDSPEIVHALAQRASMEVAESVSLDHEIEPERRIGFGGVAMDEEPERRAGFMTSAVTMEESPAATRGSKVKIKSSAKRPAAPNGYEFRGNSSGFELRRIEWVDGKRKRPYVAHLGKEEYAEMRRKNRGAKLDAAIAAWIESHDA